MSSGDLNPTIQYILCIQDAAHVGLLRSGHSFLKV